MKSSDKALYSSADSKNTTSRLMVDVLLSANAIVTLNPDQSHYIARVMRLQQGAHLRLFNGRDGEWSARIETSSKNAITLSCLHPIKPQHDSPDLMVCFAPPRGGRLETIIEKATELGARSIQPIKTARTIVSSINETRTKTLLREAAEQSERLDVPELLPMVPLATLIKDWQPNRHLLYGDETGASSPMSTNPLGNMLSSRLDMTPSCFGILAGPEGGFTPEELALLKAMPHANGVSLGPRILRVDTAVITLTALCQHYWGDWHILPRFLGES